MKKNLMIIILGVLIVSSCHHNTSDSVVNITVDYTKTIEQSIAEGNYCDVNDRITDKNFPIYPEMIGKKVEISVKLFHFNHNMRDDSATYEINKAGYRPATLMELLAFCSHSDLRKNYNIVALGSVYRDTINGVNWKLYTSDYNTNHQRALGACGDSDWWCSKWYFLAVHK